MGRRPGRPDRGVGVKEKGGGAVREPSERRDQARSSVRLFSRIWSCRLMGGVVFFIFPHNRMSRSTPVCRNVPTTQGRRLRNGKRGDGDGEDGWHGGEMGEGPAELGAWCHDGP